MSPNGYGSSFTPKKNIGSIPITTTTVLNMNIPTHWFKTTTTDGKIYLAGFDDSSSASIENIILDPNGEVEYHWKINEPYTITLE